MAVLFLLNAVLAIPQVAHALVEKPDFSRYQIILDKMPFGRLVQPPAPSAAPSVSAPVQPPLKNILKLVAIVEDPEPRAGFVRAAAARPVSGSRPPGTVPTMDGFYLRVGETSDQGETLIRIDAERGAAVLLKDGEQHTLSMRDASSAAGQAGTAMPRQPGRVTLTLPAGGAISFGTSPTASFVSERRPPPSGSYAARLEARRRARERRNEELMALATNAARPPPEVLEKQLREYNLHLIRQRGEAGPPLPIPLTPEEDELLVKEGVLPPRQ